MTLKVEDPGMLSTVQDLGRTGYRQYGVMANGAMDQKAAMVSNIMLGNSPGAGVVEATLLGPTFTFVRNTWICLMGADMQAWLSSGEAVSCGRVYPVRKGECLRLGRAVSGCRAYIAVKGGIQLPRVLGSVSTFLRGQVGGFNGRALQSGDQLPVKGFNASKTSAPLDWLPASSFFEKLSNDVRVRYIPVSRRSHVTPVDLKWFEAQSYRVGNTSDRMGYRLEGKPLTLSQAGELVSSGVTIGTIQVPANGQPIVLMNDCQTTGGYPVLGQVITVDRSRMAQLKPGDRVRFLPVTLREAQDLLKKQTLDLARLHIAAHHKWQGMFCDSTVNH